MSIVSDFKSIALVLNHQEQKAEFEANADPVLFQGVQTGGSSTPTSGICEHLPPYTPQPSSHTPPFWSEPLDEALREFRSGKPIS